MLRGSGGIDNRRALRSVQTGELAEGGIESNYFRQGRGNGALRELGRVAEDQGHADGWLKQAELSPQAVLAQEVPVVGRVGNDGTVLQLELLQRGQHLADAGVHEGQVAEVPGVAGALAPRRELS